MSPEFYSEFLLFLNGHLQYDQDPVGMRAAITRDVKTFYDYDIRFKRLIDSQGFANPEAEIYFFKAIRPQVVQGILCYSKSLEIEVGKPLARQDQLDYLHSWIQYLELFRVHNDEFIRYIRLNRSDRDQEYFLRKSGRNQDMQWHSIDKRYSTGYDVKLAKWLAYNRLISLLEMQLHPTSKNQSARQPANHETGDSSSGKLLKTHQVLRLLKISQSTLQRLRNSGQIPYTKIGGTIYYFESQILLWLQNTTQN